VASHIKRRKTCAQQAADNTAAGSISYCTCTTECGNFSWIFIPCRAGSGVIRMVSLRLVTETGFCRFMFVLASTSLLCLFLCSSEGVARGCRRFRCTPRARNENFGGLNLKDFVSASPRARIRVVVVNLGR